MKTSMIRTTRETLIMGLISTGLLITSAPSASIVPTFAGGGRITDALASVTSAGRYCTQVTVHAVGCGPGNDQLFGSVNEPSSGSNPVDNDVLVGGPAVDTCSVDEDGGNTQDCEFRLDRTDDPWCGYGVGVSHTSTPSYGRARPGANSRFHTITRRRK